MNQNIEDYIKWARLGMVVLFLISMKSISFSQEEPEKHRTYIGIEYLNSSGQHWLTATVTARISGERGRKKLDKAEVEFYYLTDTSEVLLGKAITNFDGDALFEIPQTADIKLNSEGEYLYMLVFKGDVSFKKVSKEIAIKPMNLLLSFIEIDSIKTIAVSAFQMGPDGVQIAVDEDVSFYVPRQFSNLKIGEVELVEGKGTIDFPITLPGDSTGSLNIIARVEESSDFGSVEVSAIKDWAAPRLPIVIERRRGLGDTDAPLWMVYTLIILMSAVWLHYIYLMYVLLIIKRKGKMSA